MTMYDLNLIVPDITSSKYSDDNKFRLLKNYLYQLNETLSFALSDKTSTLVNGEQGESISNSSQHDEDVKLLSAQSMKKFNELKEKIITTAEDIQRDYSSKITETEEEILQTVSGSYVLNSEFGEYKNQVDTSLDQNADSISLVAENVEKVTADVESVQGDVESVQGDVKSLDDDLQEFKEQQKSEFIVQADNIMSKVENTFTLKEETAELESRVGSQIVQSATDITENYTSIIARTQEDLSTVGGSFAEFVSELDVYIRRGELESGVYGIEIGRSDSNIKARFTNDRLSFYQGIAEVAYISGSSLYINNAQILDYLKLGNDSQGYFVFDTTKNGLEVRWIDVG